MPVDVAMKRAVKELSKGQMSITEREKCIEGLIVEAMGIASLDERSETYRKLKRKEWYMLLKATRR